MVLVDFSQTMLSTWLCMPNSKTMNEDLFRHMVINNLLSYQKRFGEDYGEMIVCCDDRHYWRKDIFKYYKASRKKDRAKSKLDWNEIFSVLNKVRDEIKDNLQWKVITVNNAEADDIIATFCQAFDEPHIIISSDKDFAQLQSIPNIAQYRPAEKRFWITEDPKNYLFEHIIRGDIGDGIPNIRSHDSILIEENTRQKPITKGFLESIKKDKNYIKDSGLEEQWNRNNALINLFEIPKKVIDSVVNQYHEYELNQFDSIESYLDKYKLSRLKDRIEEFV